MRVLTVSWDEMADDTKITIADEFNKSDRIVKLDVLRDISSMTLWIYEDLLKRGFDGSQVLDKIHCGNDKI
jgi:hypothetical protein